MSDPSDTAGNVLRQPPHSFEAERALLGAIMMNNNALSRVAEMLEPDHFADPVNGAIYEACRALMNRGVPVNPVTLKSFVESNEYTLAAGGMSYLGTIAGSAVTIINAAEYGRLIYDLWLRREIIGLAADMANTAYDGQTEGPASDQIEAHIGSLAELLAGRQASGLITLGQAVGNVIKQHERVDKGEITGLSTGLAELDRAQGLMEPGDFLIWAGRPSMGKSALMGTAAINAGRFFAAEAEHENRKHARKVVVFSQEMSDDDNANRALAAETGIEAPRRRRGTLDAPQWAKLIDAQAVFDRLPILIDARPRATLSRIRAVCRQLQHRGGVGILFVDYLQIMGAERGKRFGNRTEEVGYFATGLKDLAKELGCPVVALSQLNRGVEQREDKRPGLSDLRESGEIEQAADVIGFCYRDEYYLERSEPKHRPEENDEKFLARHASWQQQLEAAAGKAEVIVAKARHGTTGTARLTFDGARTWFADAADARPSFATRRAGGSPASFSAMPDGRPLPPEDGLGF